MKVSIQLLSALILPFALAACATSQEAKTWHTPEGSKPVSSRVPANSPLGGVKDELRQSSKFSALSQNIRFEVGSAELTSSTKRTLNELATEMKKSKDSFGKMRITGFTDPTGSTDRNQRLSEQRAVAVKNYLTSRGVSAKQIETRGLGAVESDQMASASEHARDRRVDFEIVE